MKKIRKTQVASIKALTPTIGKKQMTVYGAIKALSTSTNRNIAKHLGCEINRVTGRVTELVNKGMVKASGTVLDANTNRTVTVWEAV